MTRSEIAGSGVGITPAKGRPLRADARRNRGRVLAAARAVFALEGSDASLDEIARRAGVGPGTVYRHFATKEALFEAVVLDRIGELVEEARILVDDPDPGAAFATFVARLGREGAQKRDLIEALADDGVHLQLSDAPIVRALTDALADLLNRAQRAGAVRSDIGADDVMVLLTGVAYAICHAQADDDRSGQLLAVIYDGLRADRTATDR